MILRRAALLISAAVLFLPGQSTAIVNGTLESGFAAVGALEADTGGFSSAVLIDPYWILATARYVDYVGGSGGVFHVGFDRSSPSQSHAVSAMFPHPAYDPTSGVNDIALLRLATPVTGESPLPHLTSPSSVTFGADILFVGYGWATTSDPSNTLRRSCAAVISDVDATTFTTFDTSTGPYFGDAGGPALLQIGGTWHVAGIISMIAGGALQFTISTKVPSYAGFIADVIANNPPPTTAAGSPSRSGLKLRNSPNPFNPSTTINFELSRPTHVRLAVFDSAGRLVASLRSGHLAAGAHTVRWRALDDRGHSVASGCYLLRLQAGSASATRRVTLLK